MRFIVEDSRRLPADHSWGLGIWYFGWDESAIDLNLGFHSFSLSWQRRRPKARDALTRLRRFLRDPTWGLGIYRDPDGIWAVSIGPLMHEFLKSGAHES